MPTESSSGKKPTSRRYSPEEKAAAVRMVRALRAELGTEQGTVSRVARQLGYGVESVRSWVRQADIDDGYAPGVSTAESARIKALEQENRELKRANEILKRAASFFGAELDRQHKKKSTSSTNTARGSGSGPSASSWDQRGCGGLRAPTTRPSPALRRSEPAVTPSWVRPWSSCGRTTTASTGRTSCGKRHAGPATTWAAI